MNSFKFYFHVFITLAWLFLNGCYKLLQWIVWELSGTNQSLRRSSISPCSQQMVQALKVRGRFKFCQYLFPASVWDFLLTHDDFVRPEYVLQEHITLYAIVGEEAIFVECHPNVKIWSSKTCSFSMVAQHDKALNVIRMPIQTMHYLADKVGDPKGKLIFLSNCGRCGSTLVSQMFEATGRVIALAEPNCINFIFQKPNSKCNKEDYFKDLKRKIKSTISILCNTEAGKVDAYLLKICAPVMDASPLLKEVFPESSHLYLYRDPLKVIQSLNRLGLILYSLNLNSRIARWSPLLYTKVMTIMGFPSEKYRVDVKTKMAICMVQWLVHMRMYLDLKENNMKIAAIRYEDIIKDHTNSLSKIFAYCDLDQNLVEKTKTALNVDSQANTMLSRERMENLPLLPYTGAAKEECDVLCKHYGFPPVEEFEIVDFTITHPTVSMQDIHKNK